MAEFGATLVVESAEAEQSREEEEHDTPAETTEDGTELEEFQSSRLQSSETLDA